MKYSQKTLHSSPERARYGVSFVSSKGNILCRLVKIELYKIFAIINRAIKGLHCISEHMLEIKVFLYYCPQDATEHLWWGKKLVQVMALCRQTTSHYLRQCWPRSMLLYGITRLQWVKSESLMISPKHINLLTSLRSLRRQDISSHNIDYVEVVGSCYIWGRISTTCVVLKWSNDIKCKYMFMFPLKNLAHKGLRWACCVKVIPI